MAGTAANRRHVVAAQPGLVKAPRISASIPASVRLPPDTMSGLCPKPQVRALPRRRRQGIVTGWPARRVLLNERSLSALSDALAKRFVGDVHGEASLKGACTLCSAESARMRRAIACPPACPRSVSTLMPT